MTPTIESGMPIQANSKKPKGCKPLAESVALMRMFGGVPIIVMVPPTLAATARAMSCGETARRATAQICTTTGSRQATVAVFDETEDRMIVTIMMAAIRRFSPVPAAWTTVMPMRWARPVWNIAAPMTNMPAKSTTVEFDRPEKTCFGVRTPSRPRAIEAPIAVTASGMSSVTKKKAATPRTIRVNTAGSINRLPSF